MKKAGVFQRLMARAGYRPVGKRNGGWLGSVHSRLTSDWMAATRSANAEILDGGATLRARARDLEKNSPLVRRYLSLVAENVVGAKGVTLQMGGTQSKQARNDIERAFKAFGSPTVYTADGHMGRPEFERTVISTVARDGEAFVRKVRHGLHGVCLQLLDAALVDETFNRTAEAGQNAVKLGIEVDQWDRPVAYHVLTSYPNERTGSYYRERLRIPAEEIYHLFKQRRAGQVRGESWLAPVMLTIRIRDGYTEAELTAARTAAAKMGWITRDVDAAVTTDPDAPVREEMEASPGVIDYLEPGEQFQSWNPDHPSQNFALFVTKIDKDIASGLNVATSSLNGDLREVNFASSRVGLIQERDHWASLQQWLITHFCDPVYNEWRAAAWTVGVLSERTVPGRHDGHVWQPRGWTYFTNPNQEVMAEMSAIAAALTSPQRVMAAKGIDPEEVLTELEQWAKMTEAHGITTYHSNAVVVDEDSPSGDTEPDANDRQGGASHAGGRRQPYSGVAIVRNAG